MATPKKRNWTMLVALFLNLFLVGGLAVSSVDQHIKYNKAKQHQPLRGLDSLVAALFVHGFAIIAQKPQLQVCRCWQR